MRKRIPRYLKKTYKFKIEVPTTVSEALELDKKNGDTHWADVIAGDINNVKVTFDVLTDGHNSPIGHQFVKCHMIFDVKMEDFHRKTQYVAGRHMKNTPPKITYVSVMSREKVCLALTFSTMNCLQVKAADIMNAYVTDSITEKILTVLVLEFGADTRKRTIIVRALYRLNSCGDAFRNHLAD